MRIFVAINSPEELKEKILEVQGKVKAFGDLKLVERQNLHITLKFLGEVDDKKAEEAKKRLSGISFPSFDLSLRGVGVFPSPGSARVIWIGAREGCKEVKELAKMVESSLEGLGFEKEKRFSCHLTVARVREIRDQKGFTDLLQKENETDYGSFRVEGFDLMRSQLQRTGPVYSRIQSFRLGSKPE